MKEKEKIKIYESYLFELAEVLWETNQDEEKVLEMMEKLKAYHRARIRKTGNHEKDRNLQEETLKNLAPIDQQEPNVRTTFL
jgi:hypothetical protein